jgi:hypothetical protein
VSKIKFQIQKTKNTSPEIKTGYIKENPHSGFGFEIFQDSECSTIPRIITITAIEKRRKEIPQTFTQKI